MIQTVRIRSTLNIALYALSPLPVFHNEMPELVINATYGVYRNMLKESVLIKNLER